MNTPIGRKLSLAEQRSLRNEQILKMWETDSLTLDAIGSHFGITRERARQILRELGAMESTKIRAKRRDSKAQAQRRLVDDFLSTIRELLVTLQQQDESINDVRTKLKAAYPKVDDEIINGAIRRSKIVFKKSATLHLHFSEDAVRAGVWFALGIKYDKTATREETAALLSAVLVEEISSALAAEGMSPFDIESVLRRVTSGKLLISVDPTVSLAHAKYEGIRNAFFEKHGIVSAQGQTLWPPTRQTVMKRFGHNAWSDAVASLGLAQSARKGRPKGQLEYSAADYAGAVRDFISYSEAYRTSSSLDNYEKWVKLEKQANRNRPSGGSVRNVYRTWTKAIQSKGDPLNVGQLAPDA